MPPSSKRFACSYEEYTTCSPFFWKVRMGTDKDPEHEDKTGSNPLRQGCPTEEDLRKGFSLVYLSRTVSRPRENGWIRVV